MPSHLVGALALCAAGFVQGCTGFGLALVAAPLMMIVLAPTTVVPMIVLSSTLNCVLVTIEARRHIRLGLVLPLALGGVVGVQIGVFLLQSLDPAYLKVGVGAFVFLVALTMLVGFRMPLGSGILTRIPVGAVSGLVGGATSMGGPPVVLFLANQNTPKNTFRANLVCYFLMLNCVAVATFCARGMLTQNVLLHVAAAVPLMVCGTFIGVKVSKKVPEKVFAKAVMILVGFMGIVLIIRGVTPA